MISRIGSQWPPAELNIQLCGWWISVFVYFGCRSPFQYRTRAYTRTPFDPINFICDIRLDMNARIFLSSFIVLILTRARVPNKRPRQNLPIMNNASNIAFNSVISAIQKVALYENKTVNWLNFNQKEVFVLCENCVVVCSACCWWAAMTGRPSFVCWKSTDDPQPSWSFTSTRASMMPKVFGRWLGRWGSAK